MMLAANSQNSLLGLPQASNFAGSVDALYAFIFWFGVIAFIGVVACLIYWPYKYSRKKVAEDQTPYIEGHNPTEIGVAVLLFVVTMIIFGWGYYDYHKMRHAPADAITINVVGEKWRWNFLYPNGRKITVNSADDDKVLLPRGKSVRLVMTSEDVVHSFFVPNFRVKQDVVPGIFTSLWFEPTINGEHDIFCAEYCGTNHSTMLAKFTVVEPEAYTAWHNRWELEQSLQVANLAATMRGEEVPELPVSEGAASALAAPAISLADKGAELFQKKMCLTCHSVDGRPGVGPTQLGIFGTQRTLADGSQILVDENYIRESLIDPAAKVAAGFAPAMPTYKGQLSAEEITAIIEYIKSLQGDAAN